MGPYARGGTIRLAQGYPLFSIDPILDRGYDFLGASSRRVRLLTAISRGVRLIDPLW